MDTSNILNFVSVRKLEKSEEPAERQLATEAAKALHETVKKLKPYLRHVATPIWAPYTTHTWWPRITRGPYLRWRWWRINSFRGIELVCLDDAKHERPVLFIDEKGHFRRGLRGYGLTWLIKEDFYYTDVTKDADAWKDFPFGTVVSALTTVFEDAVSRRERALASLKAGTALLKDMRQKFGV
jgi:hypothetical protein